MMDHGADTPLTAATHAAWSALRHDAALLHGAIQAEAAAKGLPAPTAQDTADWLAAATIWLGAHWPVSGTLQDVLADLGFAFAGWADIEAAE